MDGFFQSNPGIRSRIAHHVDFPDYGDAELLSVAETMLAGQITVSTRRPTPSWPTI
jgi:hypothetical protein